MQSRVLTVFNYFVAALMLMSVCMIDSQSIAPAIVFTACLVWIFIYNLFW